MGGVIFCLEITKFTEADDFWHIENTAMGEVELQWIEKCRMSCVYRYHQFFNTPKLPVQIPSSLFPPRSACNRLPIEVK